MVEKMLTIFRYSLVTLETENKYYKNVKGRLQKHAYYFLICRLNAHVYKVNVHVLVNNQNQVRVYVVSTINIMRYEIQSIAIQVINIFIALQRQPGG